MLQYQNITSVSITTDLIIEVIRYWETDKLMVANSSFPIFCFFKKNLEISHWQLLLSVISFEASGLVSQFLGKCLPNTLSVNLCISSVK